VSLPQAFGLAALVTGAGVLVGGWLISTLEPERFDHVGEGAWWAITTITTVGYGDLVPATAAGRAVAAGLMLLGFAALAFVTATMASIIIGEVRAEERLIEREETEVLALLAELNERLERVERAVAGEPVSPSGRARGARAGRG
jgi:voltage-gated potassium channel